MDIGHWTMDIEMDNGHQWTIDIDNGQEKWT